MADKELNIYSGRDAPELAPLYRLFEGLTGVKVNVQKIYHLNAPKRVLAERDAPQADLMVANSQVTVEALRQAGVFDPYQAEVARGYDSWLRAPDYGWLSFTAWPRSVMINRQVLPNPKDWPTSIEDFTQPSFKNGFSIATVNEETTVSQVSSIRIAKGDAYAFGLVERLLANGLKRYAHNGYVREQLIAEGNTAAMVNSSNCNVFLMAGNPIGEAWIDQEPGGLGTHVEAHTIAVLKGARHPECARDFIDFILGREAQTLLARMYGETPVNSAATHGTVKPLAEIVRTEAPMERVTALRDETRAWLEAKGFAPPPDYVPPD